ncbi:MAG: substrate-binding domain-containing protein [Oceanipulchritudo sp.]
MSQRKRVVTLLVSAVASSMRDMVRGVSEYAKEERRWHLVLHLWGQVNENTVRWINQGDGIIFDAPLRSSDVRSPKWSIPAVGLHNWALAKEVPLVTSNYEEVGRRAAAYFLEKGLTHLAYLSYASGDPAETGFREEAGKADCSVSSHYIGPGQPELDPAARKDFIQWLSDLPPPTGLLVREDFLAQKVMDWIPTEWMPERLALLGVGNDSIVCDLADPTLSSVDRNARKIGRTAARILDRLMEGEAISPGPVLLDPGMVIERQSTGLRYTPDPLVTRAVRLLEETLHEAPKADQVCAHLKVSRSTLENRFRQTLGHSIWKQRRQLQIERARYLLSTTTDPMSLIAEQCGFAHQQHLAEAFAKMVGVPPSRYRAESKAK